MEREPKHQKRCRFCPSHNLSGRTLLTIVDTAQGPAGTLRPCTVALHEVRILDFFTAIYTHYVCISSLVLILSCFIVLKKEVVARLETGRDLASRKLQPRTGINSIILFTLLGIGTAVPISVVHLH